MKKLTLVLTLTIVMVGLSGMANAQMSNKVWKAKVPFAFQVENQKLPAGEYLFQSFGGHIRLTSADGSKAVTVLSFANQGTRTENSTRLNFNNYGGQHFLAGVFFAGQEESREILKSKLEVELSKGHKPAVAIIAGQ